MSTTYGGSISFPSLITIPSDGDLKPATSVNAALEGLADRTAHLKANGGDLSVASYDLWGASRPAGTKFSMVEFEDAQGDFAIASDEVQVPTVGFYLVMFTGNLTSSLTNNPQSVNANLQVGSATALQCTNWRYSATPGDPVHVSGIALVRITAPATEKISVQAAQSNTTMVSFDNRLILLRLGVP